MPSRACHSIEDLQSWCRFLMGNLQPQLPVTVSWKKGASRSLDQNALLWKWNGEIAAQLGDTTPEEVHAENKLTVGIPILRENDDFRETYDATLRPLPYERKLKLMEGELISVTRVMTTKEMSRFMDEVYRKWTERGMQLTLPDGV